MHVCLAVLLSCYLVLQDNPEDALRIFTEDMSEVKQLPRDKVVNHLSGHAPALCIPYLVRGELYYNKNPLCHM